MRQRRTAPAPHEQFDVHLAIRDERRTAGQQERQFDVEIARMAERRGGVVTRPELLALGLSAAAIGRRLAAGRLHLLHRGVYAVGHEALTWHARAHAALLAVGDDSGLSHASAAIAYRTIRNEGQDLEVTVKGRARRSRPGLRVHTSSVLEVRTLDGLRVTTPARTLLDLAAREDVSRPLAEAQVLRLVTVPDLWAELKRSPHHHGAAALARLIDTTAPTRSELERRLSEIIRRAGLPMPRFNARVGRYEVDALWERERVVVETDGWAAHGHRAAFERDRAKDAELLARGYVVLRFTWRQVMDEPLLVVTRIAQVLAAR
jgi:very-short-patch-repair endonuclease